MKQKGNISIILLCSLVVLFAGASVTLLAAGSKYEAKTAYQRTQNRYIAESGADMAVGLFLSCLDNQEYIVSYTKNEDGSYSILDSYSPYLLDDIADSLNADDVSLKAISDEANSYMSSIGFLDFSHKNGIEIEMKTFMQKENIKLSQMCSEPGFLVESEISGKECRSKINPIYLTVKVQYKNGEVLCNAQISDIYIVRDAFSEAEVSALASVKAFADISKAKVTLNNYQNYRTKGGDY